MATVVRDARLARGWTQEDLAERSGFSRVWINRFEQTAIAEPSFSRILTLCNILGITLTVSYAIDPDVIDPDAMNRRASPHEKAKEGETRSREENITESISDKMADEKRSRQQRPSKNAATILKTLALRAKQQNLGGIEGDEIA
ncbi:multiprotein-bridging factor 1 family protein [Bifidobacterium aquikefiricola]|uniref:Helix-turn-helix transcriptional regulator n=1 Tax=Bifidobacterium aquikefiricola TaxID=3059038 RepID=A0AB39U4R8_9BIFI